MKLTEIVEPPNFPLISWLLLSLVGHFLGAGRFKSGLQFVADGFLFTWAYLEIAQGHNYFRRGLGMVVMLAIVIGHFS